MRASTRCVAALIALSLAGAAGADAVEAQTRKTNASPPTTERISMDDPEYLFLSLGTETDYLRAERWRIIDQVEAAIPPLYEPNLPFHGYTLPPGAWRISLKAGYLHNPSDFGTDDFYSMFFDEVEMDVAMFDLNVLYGFEVGPLRDLVVNVHVPYKAQRTRGSGHPFRIDPMVMTMEGAGEGLGDVSVTIKKKWVDQGNGPLTFSTMLGVIFPTAQDDQEFNASQTISMMGTPTMAVSADIAGSPKIDLFGREADDLLFPRVAQPGNGSFGVRFGFGATVQMDRGALHAGAVFDYLADNDGITPGNEFRYGASYIFPPLGSDHVALDLGVFGRWRGDERFPGTIMHPQRDPATGGPMMDADMNMRMFVTGRPDFEHGNFTMVSPSLILVASPNSRFIVSPAFRVLEPARGPSPRWRVTVSQTFTF